MFLKKASAFLAVLTACLAAGQDPIPPQRHDLSVRLVLVDGWVFDGGGRFVSGLTPGDFEVREDGKPVPVLSVEMIASGAGASASGPRTPAAVDREASFFVIFDSVNTVKRMLDRNRDRIVEKLLSIVRLGRRVMVLEMPESGGLSVLQPLTSEPGLIEAAVERAAGSLWVEKAADTLSVPSILAPSIEAKGFGPPAGANKFEKSRRDIYEAETRARFEKTVNGLLAALNLVKAHPGRKSVLFVSGGIPSISFSSTFSGAGGTIEDSTAIQSQVDAAKIHDPFKSLAKPGFRSGQEILEDMIRFANSHNISFYAIDPDNYLRYVLGDMAYDNMPRLIGGSGSARKAGAPVVDEMAEIRKIELSKLESLAESTGGEAFLGGAKFEAFQTAVERDFALSYELSYTPLRKKPDGRFHRIEVRVLKPGCTARFRAGYQDYTEEQERTLAFASAAYSPELFKSFAFEARLVPYLQGRDKAVLWLLTSLPAGRLAAPEDGGKEPRRLRFQITVDDGSGSGYLSDLTIPLIVSPAVRERLRGAAHFGFNCRSEEMTLKPGTYRTIISVADEDTGEIGAVTGTMSIKTRGRDAGRALVGLVPGRLGPASSSRSPSFAIAREDGALALPGSRFLPMAEADFDRTSPAAVLVQANLPPGQPAPILVFRFLNNRRPVGTLASQLVAEARDEKSGLWTAVFALGIEDALPGSYELEAAIGPDAAGEAGIGFPVRVR